MKHEPPDPPTTPKRKRQTSNDSEEAKQTPSQKEPRIRERDELERGKESNEHRNVTKLNMECEGVPVKEEPESMINPIKNVKYTQEEFGSKEDLSIRGEQDLP